MGVQGAKPPAGARGVPAFSPFPKRLADDALVGQLPINLPMIKSEIRAYQSPVSLTRMSFGKATYL
jgi:hypothetical protein